MREDVLTAALAGLLHDIGKFAQRADAPKREIMDQEARKQVKYEHALAGYSFVQDFAQSLPESVRRGLSPVAYHHSPKTVEDDRVRLADWLSAGERDELDGATDDKRVPYLRSVFSRLSGYDQPWYWPLRPLQFASDHGFPQRFDAPPTAGNNRDQYRRLWEGFTDKCLALKGVQDPLVFLERMYNLMLEYTWCIPSAYYNAVPDVSLFDHCRTTAALAAAFTVDGRDAAWCKAVEGDDHVALLVAGDVNGVQDFIYTLASTGALKTLRGRSFYVQMLTEVVADYVIGELGLPVTNLIYVGGGNFYLLAGATQEDAVQQARAEITRRLVAAHRGALHLTLAWTPVKRKEFQRNQFHLAWQRLQEAALLPAKHRPLSALTGEELFQLVGMVQGSGGDTSDRCSICDAERLPGEDISPTGSEEVRKCSLCSSFESLGSLLTHGTHLVWQKAPAPAAADVGVVGNWQEGLANFGARITILDVDRPGEDTLPESPTHDAGLVRVSRLSQRTTRSLHLGGENAPVVEVMRPAGQLIPHHDGEARVLTIEEMAKQSGFERWGVLRLDVDNLGSLFQKGFATPEGNNLTLSRLASLSLALRLFFEGLLPHLVDNSSEETQLRLTNRLYLQYAGGDDVFVIGNWEALPPFAALIRDNFDRFTGHNPTVTLSGGISVAEEHYPLYQAAREAAAAEDLAKGYRPEKDAVAFLGQALPWEKFDAAMKRAEELAVWCDSKRAPKSLLQTLMHIDEEYRGTPRGGKLFFGPWMWVLAYQLTRAAAQSKDKDVKEGIIRMRDELPVRDGPISTIGLAARWAQYLCRQGHDR